ncbi:MAG: hypothetical protein IJ190_02875 [Prevotella sp.]|nr:hypothetical protein [Prevotella sp.]
MRKFYLLFAAMFAYSVVATAGIKNLFKQDFETAATPADAGWTSPNLAGGMSIVSSDEGAWFEFSLGSNNNRNAVMTWNPAEGTIFDGQDVKEYTVKFQWGFTRNTSSPSNTKNAQFSTEIAIISPHNYQLSEEQIAAGLLQKNVVNSVNNGQYAAHDSLRIFSITQLKGAYSEADGVSTNPYWEDGNDNSNYINDFYINGDTENVITLEEGAWYDITVTVNAEARTLTYSIYTLAGDLVKEGEDTIAENCDPYAKGINVLLGRYNAIADIDEVKVQVETEGDYANAPSIAMTGVDMAKRTYLIFFEDGEILHVKGTDGAEDTSVDSPYEYVTETSGTLEAWTENGTALSEHASVEVDASVITLPEAVVDITKVNSGYVKTYKMTVDNSTVPTQPTITLTYKYNGEGDEDNEVPSGTSVDVTEKGVLEVTTHAYGFASSTVTINNDVEFAIDNTVDFQHMDEAALTEKGFAEIDELRADNMSGENNWTARSRMWYGIANGTTNDDGTPGYDTHVVYGPTTNDEAAGIRRFLREPSTLTQEAATTIFAPVYTWYTGEADPAVADGSDVAGLKMNYGIGLINTGCKGDGGTSINYPNGPIGVDGLTDNDYFIVYVISDYGSSSLHPLFPEGTSVADATAAYKAMNLGDGLDASNLTPTNTNVNVLRGTETYSLYRIDTAIARIDIFKAQTSGIKEIINGQAISDHNAPIYNLNGVQVNPNTLKKGIYVKQGKKFVVQ